MRKRGKEIKGKKTKDKQKCKIYIFYEGETERIYLQHFENREYNVEIIPVPTEHTDARGIVLYAKKYIEAEKLDLKLGDRGYCVFDSDPKSNPDIKQTFNILHGCEKKGLYGIYSNPCFEVWFVLHYRTAPYGKTAMQMKSYLKSLISDSEYSETTDIYEKLYPMQEEALKRARELHNSQELVHKTVYSHECNPYTDIFKFLDYMKVVKIQNAISST